ncbi:shufflon system plasmid conjugative transfer pilus tip adhesin PilV [Pseudomonas sp. GOM7]|uniref:shufflon system plasmid conjugative transfer pilus tip adhesin PilV n=1 Tax=Pseudomonas sp. GOM7 TaxID=2998079 RepID=UPI00227C6FFE|nr:shufflon system plasmid conjugative transfer pilus tip adhesin PilV [Pseudomonas sp. GOM7]WAJ37255.1 shufflon system plasmid conjugative transfer pilus tip adhesin PilV [Pseudomonas sp. GOM7]
MISKRSQSGFLGVDAVITLIVLSIMIALATGWVTRQMDQQDYRIAADQQRTVAEAFSKYLKDHYSTVLANATATAPAQITVAMLRSTQYLPDGYSDTNLFGQTIIGLARRPNPNQLEAIVITTDGRAIPEIGVRTIAENLGGPGGFISSLNSNVIQGIRGGWQLALSNYGISPGPGHTASALFLMDGELANDYLYRNAVPGRPELNTMNTAINMGGNDINNADQVNTRAVTASESVTAETVEASSWFRSTGDTGWYSEKWGGGIYQSDAEWLRVFNDKGLLTGGRIRGGTIESQGRVVVGEYLDIESVAQVDGACAKTGLVSKNSQGGLLTCQGGVWRASGGASLGATWAMTNTYGQGWRPLECPDGYVMTGLTAPNEDWKSVRCRQLK